MRYPELNKPAIARQVGCSVQNVARVLSRFTEHTQAEVEEFEVNKPGVLTAIQQRLLESVTPAKLNKTSAVGLITGFGILEDKRRLIMGLPTGMDVHVLLDLAAIVRGDRGDKTG